MKLPIPAAVFQQHLVALGKTRSGKSSKLRVLVENLLDRHKPVTIIDPKGDWWGLKSAADGKRPGYPIVIFGGRHADVPLNPRAGAHVAELIASGNRPCLIDLKGWMPGDRTRFFIDFAAKTFELTQGERYLAIDEVHNFAPKGKILSVESGLCLHWMNRLATEAQGMGLILLLASQRPQKVHNDVLTSCETLIACRVIHKADRDAIKDWIDGCADPAIGKRVLAELAEMRRTDAYVWSPEIEFGPERISWPLFNTYDSFKPQQTNTAKLKGWAEVNLDEVRAKLADVVQEAQANDPAELRRRIAQLEKQLRTGPVAAAPVDTRAIESQAYSKGRIAGITESRGGIRDLLKELHVAMDKAVGSTFDASFAKAAEIGADGMQRARTAVEVPPPAPRVPQKAASVPHATPIVPRKAPIVPRKAPIVSSDNGSLPPGEAAILRAGIMYADGLSRDALTVLTGYKRSSRDEYIRRLVARGYAEVAGDTVKATAAGRAALPDAEPLPIGDELLAYWRDRLPAGERKILDVLLREFPDAVPAGGLDEAGFKRSSRNEYLRRLRARELITEPMRGQYRASSYLFSEFINP